MRTPYRSVDEVLPPLQREISKTFNKTRLTMKFDALNVIDTFKTTKTLYERLQKLNQVRYLQIAKQAYRDAYAEAKEAGIRDGKQQIPTAAFVLALLAEYNFTTKYKYDDEIDRKRARLAEAIIADAKRGIRRDMIADFKRAESLWQKQTKQYALYTEDEAVLKAFEDAGVKRVKWNTAEDEKVCGACNGRDGKTYPIDNIPEKPHYLCRCYYTIVN